MKELLEYWPIIGVVLQGAVLWFVWSMRQLAKKEVAEMVAAAEVKAEAASKALAQEVAGHERRLGRAEGQIQEIRSDIEALPTKADFAELKGEIKLAHAEIRNVGAGVDRLEGYLMERGVKI